MLIAMIGLKRKNVFFTSVTLATSNYYADYLTDCQFRFGTSVNTQQWAQPVTARVHGVSGRKCGLE